MWHDGHIPKCYTEQHQAHSPAQGCTQAWPSALARPLLVSLNELRSISIAACMAGCMVSMAAYTCSQCPVWEFCSAVTQPALVHRFALMSILIEISRQCREAARTVDQEPAVH